MTTYTVRIDDDCNVIEVAPQGRIPFGMGDHLQDVEVQANREPEVGDLVHHVFQGGWRLTDDRQG